MNATENIQKIEAEAKHLRSIIESTLKEVNNISTSDYYTFCNTVGQLHFYSSQYGEKMRELESLKDEANNG